jgi:hypothetical protein
MEYKKLVKAFKNRRAIRERLEAPSPVRKGAFAVTETM